MSRISEWMLLAGLLVGCLIAGCGTSASGPDASAAAARANEPAAEWIEGAWQGAMLVDDEGVAGKLSDQQVAQLQTLEMGMEFRSDGSLLLTGVNGGQPYTSRNRWELIEQSGQEVTIRSIEPSGAEKEIVLVFEGKDVFLLPVKTEVAELGAMRFERLR